MGIDEVGRGPWAGPLVVGAVVLPDTFDIPGLTDSKALSSTRRNQLDALIRQRALGYGLGWVHADELDTLGLSQALVVATRRAVEQISTPYHEIIIDGTINFLKGTTKARYVTTLPKADALIPAVSAASIIAKVARDTYMAEQAAHYPHYGFESHVGYGTSRHEEALIEYGVTPLHRASFAPIRAMLSNKSTSSMPPRDIEATSTAIGAAAETRVTEWLKAAGYMVIARNWRTKYCEVDIIAQKGEELLFIEVKYRSSALHGGALEAVTPKKVRQMRFAAEVFMASAKYNRFYKGNTATLRLVAVIVEGNTEPRLIQVV